MRRHKSYDDILYHVRETDLYAGGQVNAGFDETLLVLAHMYEHGDSLNWDEADEENFLIFLFTLLTPWRRRPTRCTVFLVFQRNETNFVPVGFENLTLFELIIMI